MMNQVDSSSFDNDKDDEKKPKEWFQDWFHEKQSRRFKNQEKFDFKIQEKMNSRFKRRNQEDFTREVLKRFFKKQT